MPTTLSNLPRTVTHLTVADLVPGSGLTPAVDGWDATAPLVRFSIEADLEPGWYEVRIAVRSEGRFTVQKRADLVFDAADTNPRPAARESFAWNRRSDERFMILLNRRSRGVRLELHRAEGNLAIDDFSIQLVPRSVALARAVKEKFRLIRAYHCVRPVLLRGGRMLLTGQFRKFTSKLFKGLVDARQMRMGSTEEMDAAWWRRHSLSTDEADAVARACDEMLDPPPIAVLLPVEPTRLDQARLAAHSVRRQIYPHWEMLICAAGPSGLTPHLDALLGPDPRVRIHRASVSAGLPTAIAKAMATTECQYVVTLPPGVELAEHALYHFAAMTKSDPGMQAVGGKVYDAYDAFEAATAKNTASSAEREAAESEAATAMANGIRDNRMSLENSGEESEENPHKLPIPPVVWFTPTTRVSDRVPRRLTPKAVAEWSAANVPESGRTVLSPVLAYPIDDRPLLDRGRVGRKPPTRGKLLYLSADLRAITGYDYLAYAILKGLPSIGADIRLHQVGVVRADLVPPNMMPPSGGWAPGIPQLIISPPFLAERFNPDRASAIFTMWETDRLEPAWVEVLNRAGLVIVPSQWAVQCFRACGVETPMEVAPLGYDPLVFNPGNSPTPGVCTFGTAGALAAGGLRKNAQKVIDLFRAAFPTEENVRLRVKITPSSPSVESYDDPRIEILRGVLPHGALADWYRSLSAYVNASAGEGFGLHLIEAMACGRPLISPHYSGLTAFFEPTLGYAVDYALTPVNNSIYTGNWAEPSDESLIARMREVYANPAEARRLGERSAVRARNFTWKEAGKSLARALRRHGFLDAGNPGSTSETQEKPA